MENKSNYLYVSNAGKYIKNINNEYIKKQLCDIFSEISNLGTEGSSIYLLSILFMMSGFLLFIYGLFLEHIYQFVMGFIFLISGFILDNTINQKQVDN
ncbi:hypothetical protein SDC9_122216 [bioreactor metagenome]|uniref:YrhK domain-containing protein n=1 Tax=bioreactor metagenome TaxID=1076179 RepID=A0A645CE94_9ZZZZ